MLYHKALDIVAAGQLARWGARAPVLRNLTGLSDRQTRQLVWEVTGSKPASGQFAYTTAWFEKTAERQIHARVFLSCYGVSCNAWPTTANCLAKAYELYLNIAALLPSEMQDDALDINRAFSALRLFHGRQLTLRSCVRCKTSFIAPSDALAAACQACQGFASLFCRNCGAPLPAVAQPIKRGKPRQYCDRCAAR